MRLEEELKKKDEEAEARAMELEQKAEECAARAKELLQKEEEKEKARAMELRKMEEEAESRAKEIRSQTLQTRLDAARITNLENQVARYQAQVDRVGALEAEVEELRSRLAVPRGPAASIPVGGPLASAPRGPAAASIPAGGAPQAAPRGPAAMTRGAPSHRGGWRGRGPRGA